MHETKQKYGESIDPVNDYENYLALLGLKKKHPRAQSCEDVGTNSNSQK
jgi:hypothetical protein